MTAKGTTGQLPLGDEPSAAQVVNNEAGGRVLIRNGGGELIDPFPAGSKAEALFLNGGPLSGEDPEDQPENEGDYYWFVPAQDRIEVMGTKEGTVEIHQISPLGNSEDVRIDVAQANCVRLARMILWAAGFKVVLIAQGGPGGWTDLDDGAVPARDEAGTA